MAVVDPVSDEARDAVRESFQSHRRWLREKVDMTPADIGPVAALLTIADRLETIHDWLAWSVGEA